MPDLIAHSEQHCKYFVRNLRRAVCKESRYFVGMRLRIEELLAEKRWTVQELADRAGMSKSYLSEIKNGIKPANSRRIQAIAKALEVSPVDLIDDDSVPPDVLEHMRTLSELSPSDREAVIRHAASLAMKDITVE